MAGEIRALTIARAARRKGVRRWPLQRTTDLYFLWRINAAINRLRHLLAIQERGERTDRTLQDLSKLEDQVMKLLNDAQLVLIEQALSEEKKVCDG